MDPWEAFVRSQKQASIRRNRRRRQMMQAAVVYMMEVEEEVESSGSRNRRQVIRRDRKAMDERLKALYFTSPSQFQGDIFRRRYRMRPHIFDSMMCVVVNHDRYFVQREDVVGDIGFSTEQKLTCAMKMLSYGLPADLCDEFLDITESTAIEILKHFTRAIYAVFHEEYPCRPSKVDLQRLLDVADKRGFPGMIGSLDCMHWQWKNCLIYWQRHFTGYKGKPTIILEAVASYDTWIWHSFFGLPGSLNDINVLGQSPLFNEVCQDGIYPKYASFVKTIRNPVTPPQAYFSTKQEAYRKDVERAFGILQARFTIVKGPARGWDREDLQYIMMACIILHNMIVEDERDEYEGVEIDPEEVPTRPRRAEMYDRVDEDIDVERNEAAVARFMDRRNSLICPVIHGKLQEDLVNHLWSLRH